MLITWQCNFLQYRQSCQRKHKTYSWKEISSNKSDAKQWLKFNTSSADDYNLLNLGHSQCAATHTIKARISWNISHADPTAIGKITPMHRLFLVWLFQQTTGILRDFSRVVKNPKNLHKNLIKDFERKLDSQHGINRHWPRLNILALLFWLSIV